MKISESTYKKLVVIPIILILASVSMLFINYSNTGEFLVKGIDLEGGTQITIHYSNPVDISKAESNIREFLGVADVDVVTTTNPASRKQETVIISASGDIEGENLVEAAEDYFGITLAPNTYSIKMLGSSLAITFWSQAKWAFTFAFIFMASVVFIYFRTPYPSFTVVLAIFCDILVILGFMSLVGIKLSLATIAALLMILGYGVDSNILLANKILKESGGLVIDRIYDAMKTGLVMSASTISAMLVLVILSNSIVLQQIGLVLLIGLIADLVNTWILNGNLLLWHQK
ncbi:TPA: protein translocase subunit SecF [archaeon]|nr:protein translocase subunit SecF [Candidatus Undinarchaeales archaeon SRR5007147.bin71]